MGLMGTSISACLLGAGHSLHCVETNAAERRSARARLLKLLTHAAAEGAMRENPSTLIGRVAISADIADLKPAEIVVESTVEDITTTCYFQRRSITTPPWGTVTV